MYTVRNMRRLTYIAYSTFRVKYKNMAPNINVIVFRLKAGSKIQNPYIAEWLILVTI